MTGAHEYTVGEFDLYCLTEGVDLEKKGRSVKSHSKSNLLNYTYNIINLEDRANGLRGQGDG